MVLLLELKEKVKYIYNKFDAYIIPITRFLLALISMLVINAKVGYMSKINNIIVVLAVSVLCGILPNGATVVLLSVALILHLYALAAELALVALAIFLVMYLLYFRFTPKSSYLLIISAILCSLKLPCIVPVAAGLVSGVFAMIPACFGVVAYYIIQTGASYENAFTSQNESMQVFSFIVESMLKNRGMFITILAFAVTIAVVYLIKRLSISHAWLYAIFAGAILQFLLLIVGKLALQAEVDLLFSAVGTVLAIVTGYVLQVVFFNLDYRRTEFVQYEDDEYYYYVKAVPKVAIAGSDVKVKRINARKTTRTDDIMKSNRTYRPARGRVEEEDDFEISYEPDREDESNAP